MSVPCARQPLHRAGPAWDLGPGTWEGALSLSSAPTLPIPVAEVAGSASLMQARLTNGHQTDSQAVWAALTLHWLMLMLPDSWPLLLGAGLVVSGVFHWAAPGMTG